VCFFIKSSISNKAPSRGSKCFYGVWHYPYATKRGVLLMKKLTVGTDDYCQKCMDWREVDEAGNCKICGCHIKKSSNASKSSVEYDLSDFTPDHEEERDSADE